MIGTLPVTSMRDRESPNVVSERLGHASVAVTLSIYSHVLPGDQKAAAARFAALVRAQRRDQVPP
jgi:integrase